MVLKTTNASIDIMNATNLTKALLIIIIKNKKELGPGGYCPEIAKKGL